MKLFGWVRKPKKAFQVDIYTRDGIVTEKAYFMSCGVGSFGIECTNGEMAYYPWRVIDRVIVVEL